MCQGNYWQDSGLFMASLGMDFLCTNKPLGETVNNCCDSFFENGDRINGSNKYNLQKLLRS